MVDTDVLSTLGRSDSFVLCTFNSNASLLEHTGKRSFSEPSLGAAQIYGYKHKNKHIHICTDITSMCLELYNLANKTLKKESKTFLVFFFPMEPMSSNSPDRVCNPGSWNKLSQALINLISRFADFLLCCTQHLAPLCTG